MDLLHQEQFGGTLLLRILLTSGGTVSPTARASAYKPRFLAPFRCVPLQGVKFLREEPRRGRGAKRMSDRILAYVWMVFLLLVGIHAWYFSSHWTAAEVPRRPPQAITPT